MTDEQVLRNIAANVQRLRGDRTMSWLAEQAGTYPANIARIENAENMPGAGLLARIADVLGVGVEALLDASPHS